MVYMNQKNNISTSWENNISKLSDYMHTKDLHDFLKWDVVKYTMFVGNSPYVAKELFFLIRHNWKKWKSAIREVSFGKPTPFILYPYSSGNLIHHAYHLAKYEDITHQEATDFDYIFEFGGGYGSMARLFQNLGFEGKYIIYDIPEFSLLQTLYLENIGFKVSNNIEQRGISCISDINNIPVFNGKVLFIGTWSLSEAPVDLREEILHKVNANSYLLAYQSGFDGVNNEEYFNKIKYEYNKLKWEEFKIKHIPNNYYLFGI